MEKQLASRNSVGLTYRGVSLEFIWESGTDSEDSLHFGSLD